MLSNEWIDFIYNHFIKTIKFAMITAIGLTADIGLFYIFTSEKILSPIYANIFSSFTAVSFVFFSSSRFLFNKSSYIYLRYFIYLLYHLVTILLFSYIIQRIVENFDYSPLIAKFIVIPVSFVMHYIAINIILTFRNKVESQKYAS